jgi:D-serine deaminase-like pyridoxal phosphate-dependent protein
VFVKVDVGLHRCGLMETDPRLVRLAEDICAAPTLRFDGLFSHAGHAYGAANAGEVRAIAAEEANILNRVRHRLECAGITVPEVSVGATPTTLVSESYDGITEIRPGNYVFMDRTPVRLGLVGLDRVALFVAATVVSANDRFFIIDAGSKVLSSDLGAHGTGGAGYGIAFALEEEAGVGEAMEVVKLSEEHGFVRRGDAELALGSKVRVIPNHACPVVNLTDELVVVEDEIHRWPVAVRGCVR